MVRYRTESMDRTTNIRFLVFLYMLSLPRWAYGVFNNLKQAIEYVNHHDAYPEADNDSVTSPDYTSFYVSRHPTLLQRIIRACGGR